MSRLTEQVDLFLQNWDECRQLLYDARNQYELGVDSRGRRCVLFRREWYELVCKALTDADRLAGYDSPVVHGDLTTVENFRSDCAGENLIDYDGFGHPVRNGLANTRIEIRPSRVADIPADATHIVWFNK